MWDPFISVRKTHHRSWVVDRVVFSVVFSVQAIEKARHSRLPPPVQVHQKSKKHGGGNLMVPGNPGGGSGPEATPGTAWSTGWTRLRATDTTQRPGRPIRVCPITNAACVCVHNVLPNHLVVVKMRRGQRTEPHGFGFVGAQRIATPRSPTRSGSGSSHSRVFNPHSSRPARTRDPGSPRVRGFRSWALSLTRCVGVFVCYGYGPGCLIGHLEWAKGGEGCASVNPTETLSPLARWNADTGTQTNG